MQIKKYDPTYPLKSGDLVLVRTEGDYSPLALAVVDEVNNDPSASQPYLFAYTDSHGDPIYHKAGGADATWWDDHRRVVLEIENADIQRMFA